MKMDISNWISYNPELTVLATNRLFYKKYLYKLSYEFTKANFIRYVNLDHAHLYSAGRLSTEDYIKVLKFKTSLEKHKPNITYRLESNTVNIFAKSLDLLHDLAYNDLLDYKNYIISITLPKDNESEKFILSGSFISTLGLQYKYRVKTRSKYYKSVELKQQIGQYLKNITTEIRIGEKFLHSFQTNYKYVNQGYFYCNDCGIVDLIRLIDYSLVNSVENVVTPT